MGHALVLKASGTSRLLVGFVAGVVFAIAPMYYLYVGREAPLRGAPGFAGDAPVADAPTSVVESPRNSRGASAAFASRLTYELRQLPEELPPAVVRTPSAAVAAAAPATESEAARVVNARPISAVAPQPRDRTQAMEREAQKPEYREAPRQQAAAAPAQAQPQPQPRVVEGRDVVLKAPKLPETPTRPIVADASVNMRAEIEAERSRLSAEVARAWPMPGSADASARKGADPRSVIAVAPPIAGAAPIGRAAEMPRKEANTKGVTPSSSPSAASVGIAAPAANAGGDFENRLVATREWLAAAPQTTHTIQLMGTNSEEQLKTQLKALSKQLEPAKIFVYRTVAQGKPSMTIVYGAYADKTTAVQALGKLPAAITANRPVLRTVSGIRAEMKQHRTDS